MTPQELYNRCLADHGCDIRAHLPFLRQCAKGDCMEIGTRWGASTSALLFGIERQGGHLWSVDVDLCLIFPGHPRWTFIHGHSINDEDLIMSVVPEELDLLFIDGLHDYASVRADLSLYGPLVRGNGLILMHDTDLAGAGVRQALDEWSGERGLTPSYHEGSNGLGVLQVDRRDILPPATRRTAMPTHTAPQHNKHHAEDQEPDPKSEAKGKAVPPPGTDQGAAHTYTNVYSFTYYRTDAPDNASDTQGTPIAICGSDWNDAGAKLNAFLADQGGEFQVHNGTQLESNVLVS